MPIGEAYQRTVTNSGGSVYVLNENGKYMFVKYGTLIGYTSNRVTIAVPGCSNTHCIYDDNGRLIKTFTVRR